MRKCLINVGCYTELCFQKVDVKTGRGRNVKVVKEFKYRCEGDDDVRARIERSINWYDIP